MGDENLPAEIYWVVDSDGSFVRSGNWEFLYYTHPDNASLSLGRGERVVLAGVSPAIRDERDALRAEVERLDIGDAKMAIRIAELEASIRVFLYATHSPETPHHQQEALTAKMELCAQVGLMGNAKPTKGWALAMAAEIDARAKVSPFAKPEDRPEQRIASGVELDATQCLSAEIASLKAELATLRGEGAIEISKRIAIGDPVEVIHAGVRYVGAISGGELKSDGAIRHDASFDTTTNRSPGTV